MITDEFKSRIGIVDLKLTQFVDKNGIWAKDQETCVEVWITFIDNYSTMMTYNEYKTLPKEQRILLQEAPSSLPA